MGKCALCHLDRELKQSHILPKFAQRRIKQAAKAGDGPVLKHFDGKEMVVQNYCFEPLLCGECEQRFSSWEREAAAVLRNPDLEPGSLSERTLILEGLPYEALKLFLLSLLWRMGVSNLSDFKLVKLGPHETKLRQMLLTNAPGSSEEYGCSLIVLTDRTGRIPLTRGADTYRTEPLCRLYRIVLDGFYFIWKVGNAEAIGRSFTRDYFLKEDGTWKVCFKDRRKVTVINEGLKPVFQAGRDKKKRLEAEELAGSSAQDRRKESAK